MNPRDYPVQAAELVQKEPPSAADLRTAVSRSYYATFRACAGHTDRGVSDRSSQDLCGLLRLLRSEPVLGTVKIGAGALLNHRA